MALAVDFPDAYKLALAVVAAPVLVLEQVALEFSRIGGFFRLEIGFNYAMVPTASRRAGAPD
jgi:hypothetical protein